MRIPCRRIQPMIDRYVDGELNFAAKLVVARHLRTCSECESAAEKIRTVKNIVSHAQVAIEAPEYLQRSIVDGINRHTGKISRRRLFLSPELSWGLATVSALVTLVGYLVLSKPAVSACQRVITVRADASIGSDGSEVSSILSYFGKSERDMLRPATLSIQQTDCIGEGALILHMTVKKADEILVYTHGGYADIKPADSSGVKLKGIAIDGRKYFLGDFSGFKVVYWKEQENPCAILLTGGDDERV